MIGIFQTLFGIIEVGGIENYPMSACTIVFFKLKSLVQIDILV